MSGELTIYRNGEQVYVFDKRAGLARMQFAYVQRMDADMDRGIELDGERILNPDLSQRTRFVLGRLLDSVSINDSRGIVMLCRWLAQHVPTLDAIRIEDDGDDYRVELGYGDAADV